LKAVAEKNSTVKTLLMIVHANARITDMLLRIFWGFQLSVRYAAPVPALRYKATLGRGLFTPIRQPPGCSAFTQQTKFGIYCAVSVASRCSAFAMPNAYRRICNPPRNEFFPKGTTLICRKYAA